MATAPLAIFFSLATTFSFPGMTTYSVLKSPSMSTPSLLLGKSLMCPSEASTSKSFPRYLLMVFALAGDSTMTNDFGNVTLFARIQFEANTNRPAATNGFLAVGCWLLAFRPENLTFDNVRILTCLLHRPCLWPPIPVLQGVMPASCESWLTPEITLDVHQIANSQNREQAADDSPPHLPIPSRFGRNVRVPESSDGRTLQPNSRLPTS